MLTLKSRYLLMMLLIVCLLGVKAFDNTESIYAQTENDITLIYPVQENGNQWYISQGYNTTNHGGNDSNVADLFAIDITDNGSPGQVVIAAAPGQLWHVDESGCEIVIRHGDFFTSYLHVRPTLGLASRLDQEIQAGETLGTMQLCGGEFSGAHVHFMLNRWNGIGTPPRDLPFQLQWESLPFLDVCGQTFPSDGSVGQYSGTRIELCDPENLPTDGLDVGTIVQALGADGAYLGVYTSSDGVLPAFHLAPGDTGIVTDGPVELSDGRILWQVEWYSGFYDLNNVPYLHSDPYPEAVIGWVDETALELATQVFNDIQLSNAYFPFIDMTFTHEIFNGFTNGDFEGELDIRRGAFAQGVFNAAKLTPNTSCGDFPDVPPSHEFYVAITTLKCLGIIHGYRDGTFRPEDPVMRDQSAKFVTNTLVELGAIESVAACAAGVPQFPDVPADSLFYDDIQCVRGLGIMTGFSDGTFQPEGHLTRAQAAKVLTSGRSILYYSRWDTTALLDCGLADPTVNIYVGDDVELLCNLTGIANLYGAQLACTAESSKLAPLGMEFGDFFSPDYRMTAPPEIDRLNGILVGGVSQQNPAEPLSTDSDNDFVSLHYAAAGAGPVTVSCEPLLSSRDGFELSATLSDTTITILPLGASNGTVLFQGRQTHAGIEVTAIGSTSGTTTTAEDGAYTFNELPGGFYEIQADAPRYLPSCTTIEAEGDTAVSLPSTTIAGGDVNDNDVIDIGDAAIMGNSFNQDVPSANARADINDDGTVNILDFSILAGNYGKNGCQDW